MQYLTQSNQAGPFRRDYLVDGTSLYKSPGYVLFHLCSSSQMSMTLAARLEVFTQLSCNSLHGYQWNHIQSATSTFASDILNVSLNDPMAPYFHPYTLLSDYGANAADSNDTQNPPIPSACVSDPAVQAGAARLHAIMTTTMGILSAFTAGWWGSFSERHGRKKVLVLPPLGLFLT